jgi:CheY-like chemotaxis protein
VHRSPAQRALFRLLETTIPDRGTWERALRKGLLDARIETLPEDFDALVPFVRQHLATHLDDEERPWLISSVLEDLEAEAELARSGGDLNSSARMAIATRIPERLPTTPAPALEILDDEEEPPSAEIPRVVPTAPSIPRFVVVRKERPSVLVVDGDRFKRSALARSLVQARCDVTVLDGGDEALTAISGSEPIDVLVLDVDAPGAAQLLDALVASRPDVPVLAWTSAPPSAAEHVARMAGVRATAVVPRNALNAEINEGLRKLLDP